MALLKCFGEHFYSNVADLVVGKVHIPYHLHEEGLYVLVLAQDVGQQDDVLVSHAMPEVKLVVASVNDIQVERLHNRGLQLPCDAFVGRMADFLAGLFVFFGELTSEFIDIRHQLYNYILGCSIPSGKVSIQLQGRSRQHLYLQFLQTFKAHALGVLGQHLPEQTVGFSCGCLEVEVAGHHLDNIVEHASGVEDYG